MAITKDKMSAADAVQETFIRVYNSANRFDMERPFKPWFYRILINECNRILGKNPNTVSIEDLTWNSIEASTKDEHNFEKYEDLYKSIEKLNDLHRVVIVLKYLKDFSEIEISQILEININTVKSRLFKGRQKLRGLILLLEGGSNDE